MSSFSDFEAAVKALAEKVRVHILADEAAVSAEFKAAFADLHADVVNAAAALEGKAVAVGQLMFVPQEAPVAASAAPTAAATVDTAASADTTSAAPGAAG